MFTPTWLPKWKLLLQKNEEKIPKSQQWWGRCPKAQRVDVTLRHSGTLLSGGGDAEGSSFSQGFGADGIIVFYLQDVWYQHFLLHRAQISSSEEKGKKLCFFFPAGCFSAVPSALSLCHSGCDCP